MRAAVRSVNIDEDPRHSVPRMSDEQFAASSWLVRGVHELTLRLLDAWWFEHAGSTWMVDAVEMPDGMHNIPTEQVAIRFTLSEAAEKIGLRATFKELQFLYREAQRVVTDNLIHSANQVAKDYGA